MRPVRRPLSKRTTTHIKIYGVLLTLLAIMLLTGSASVQTQAKTKKSYINSIEENHAWCVVKAVNESGKTYWHGIFATFVTHGNKRI